MTGHMSRLNGIIKFSRKSFKNFKKFLRKFKEANVYDFYTFLEGLDVAGKFHKIFHVNFSNIPHPTTVDEL